MALQKLKQKNRDEVLDKASRSEHGMARFAHLNEVVKYINALEQRIEALEQAP